MRPVLPCPPRRRRNEPFSIAGVTYHSSIGGNSLADRRDRLTAEVIHMDHSQVIVTLTDKLVEDAWTDETLWPELEDDDDGRPVGKDMEQAKLSLATALQTIYEDWLEEQNA